MPVKRITDYKPPIYLFTGDLQTIVPALFRKVKPILYKRERLFTPDLDFLDLDWATTTSKNDHLIIISHGLEGDSRRFYVLGMVKALNNEGYDVLAWNYRGCSGEVNKQFRFYHSGETNDLDLVVRHAINRGYQKISLIGFSIGGNITLKYLGEDRERLPQLETAVAFSVPCDLSSSAAHLARFRSKIYMNRFLTSLRSKIEQKALLMPGKLNCEQLSKIRNFYEFDTLYTAPIHGFSSAEEYWRISSSKFYIKNINLPTLLVTAENDPFLTTECFPVKEAEQNKKFRFELSKTGGHCGFPGYSEVYWSEKRALDFITKGI